MNVRRIFFLLAFAILGTLLAVYLLSEKIVWPLVFLIPFIGIGFYDAFQKEHAIRRNFPVIGNMRYILESIRPEIMQYFVETDTEGKPINRLFRSLVYSRAKNEIDTTPFGTQSDVYEVGYEWMSHSIYAKNHHDVDLSPRVAIGGPDCKHPYSASLLNISAMSFGSLSENAVLAMNKGAKLGGFAQNTGEGGVSHYHLEHEGDLIWQVGTGYFGCRAEDGTFSPEKYKKTVAAPAVKMVELKLSQGAKPGHGGILPAKKNTEEIAKIRGVKPRTDVNSPPSHSAFDSAEGLMHFIKQLRDLSGGKPIGIKLCLGSKVEFEDMCKAMIKTGIKPDFISIDGGEGGTGAAPIEFSNSIGWPVLDALPYAKDMLDGYGLKKDIKLIASGKIISGFHMARMLALGADLCNSARAMMLAVGCIQALQCNTNKCPVGVATQDKGLMKGLDPEEKSLRVARYHEATVKSLAEMAGAMGLNGPSDINRAHINRRMNEEDIATFESLYPSIKDGAFLN